MAKAWDVRGYAYDGALYCSDCIDPKTVDDPETSPLFESDEAPDCGEMCSVCGEVLSEPVDSLDIRDVLTEWWDNSTATDEASGEEDGDGDAREVALFLDVEAWKLCDAYLYGTAYSGARHFIWTREADGFTEVETFTSREDAREAWRKLVSEFRAPTDTETLDMFTGETWEERF